MIKSPNRFFISAGPDQIRAAFFLQDAIYEPHRDEFLYLAENNHLAFGYMEVPPLLSLFAWVTQHFGVFNAIA